VASLVAAPADRHWVRENPELRGGGRWQEQAFSEYLNW
jgi:hypothetical protein